MSRRFSKKLSLQKQAAAALLSVLLIVSAPVVLAAVRYKINTVDYNPATQSLFLQSTGPINASVNSVNVGPGKRIILDLEDAELGAIPRDSILLQQLAQKWPAIRNISVNQFAGQHPVVRILVDVDSANYSTQLMQNQTRQVELKVSPVVTSAVVPQPFNNAASVPLVPTQNTQPINSGNIQDLKRALGTMNQRYDQLSQENQFLRTQLQQEMQKSTISLKQDPETQRLKDNNQALQSQVNKLKQDNAALQKTATVPHSVVPASNNASATEVARLKNELANAQNKSTTLQQQNTQLSLQLKQAKTAPQPAAATSAPTAQKQVVTLQQENATLKQQVKDLNAKVAATPKEPLKTLPASTVATTDPQLAELKRQVEQAKGALNRSITTINDQNKEISYLKRQVEQMQSGADAASREQMTALNGKLDQKDSEIQSLREQIAVLNDKLKAGASPQTDPLVVSLREQLQKKDSLIEQLKAENTKLAATPAKKVAAGPNSNVPADKAEAQSVEIEVLKQQLEKTREDYRKAQAQLSTEKTQGDLQKQVTQLQAQLKASDTQSQKQALEINELRKAQAQKPVPTTTSTALAGKDQKIKSLEQSVSDLTGKLSSKEAALRQSELSLEQAKRDAKPAAVSPDSQTVVQLETLKQELATVKRERDQLQQAQKTSAVTTPAADAALQTRVKNLDAQVAKLTQDLDASRKNEAQATEKLLAAQKEKQAVKPAEKPAMATQPSAETQSLKTQVDALKRDKAQLTTVNESLFAEVSELKAKQAKQPQKEAVPNAALNNQISDLEAKVDDLTAEKKKISDELEQLKKAKPAAPTTVTTTTASTGENAETLAASNTQLKKQLADNQAKLKDVDARYKKILLDYDDNQRQLKTLQAAAAKPGATVAKSAVPAKAELAKTVPPTPAQTAALDKLTADNKRLNTQVSDLTRQLQAAKTVKPQTPAAAPKAPEAVTLNTASVNPEAEAERYFAQGQEQAKNNQKPAALENYQKAVKLAPKNADYVSALALAMSAQQQGPAAVTLLQDYIDANPDQAEAYDALGRVYLANGQSDEARLAFLHAMPINTLSNYAAVLKKQGRFQDAERVLRLVLDMSPNNSEALFNLGNVYNSENNLEEAKESYVQAIRVNPSFAEAHYNLGLVYSKMGDKTSAATHLEKFLELNPSAANAEVIRNYVKKLKG